MCGFVEPPHKGARDENPGKLLPSAPPMLSPFWSLLLLPGAQHLVLQGVFVSWVPNSKTLTRGTAGEHPTAGGTAGASRRTDHTRPRDAGYVMDIKQVSEQGRPVRSLPCRGVLGRTGGVSPSPLLLFWRLKTPRQRACSRCSLSPQPDACVKCGKIECVCRVSRCRYSRHFCLFLAYWPLVLLITVRLRAPVEIKIKHKQRNSSQYHSFEASLGVVGFGCVLVQAQILNDTPTLTLDHPDLCVLKRCALFFRMSTYIRPRRPSGIRYVVDNFAVSLSAVESRVRFLT